MPPHEIPALSAELDRFFTVADSGAVPDPELALSTIPVDPRWRGLIRAIISFIYGAFPDAVSIADFVRDESTHVDWPIQEGMGTLIALLASGLPVQTGTLVTEVDWSGQGVVVDTNKGRLRAPAALVTAPTNVLASGAITFTPQLPDDKLSALEALPQGADEKIFVPLELWGQLT